MTDATLTTMVRQKRYHHFSLFIFIIVLGVLLGYGVSFPTTRLPPSSVIHTPNTIVVRSPFVSASGTKLILNGEAYQFTGVNAFHLASLSHSNAGCGGQASNLDTFFSNLRPNSAVRIWAFQGSAATNTTTKLPDWSGLDRVITAASHSGVKLILVLGDQAGTCDDGHWKDRSWYEGGYTKAFNDSKNGLTPLPYIEYVRSVVSRYKDSTTIAMWEPINEPSSADCIGATGTACYTKQTCTDEGAAASALRHFFDTVGGEIHAIDKHHLISSGVIGTGQCGAVFEDYLTLHQSPGIDVASYHDYDHDDEPLPGDQWNGLQQRLNQMKQIGKPLIVGEVGMKAVNNSRFCMNYETRTTKMKAKMDAQFAAGIAGFMPWDLTLGSSKICNYDIVLGDPLLSLLRNYPVSMPQIPNSH